MSVIRPAHPRATRLMIVASLLLAPLLLAAAVLVGYQSQADASSHREAPLISKDPFADTTDVYAFIPPMRNTHIVLAASWIPFEGPEGGPNYYEWDPHAVYEIYVDSDGDASPNMTYTLSSRVVVVNPNTFLYNVNPIDALNDTDWNRRQYITVTETLDDGTMTNLIANQPTAPVNIGSKSTPNYAALEQAAIYSHNAPQGEIKIFAGQTDDAFWVDLQVFDLLTLRGQNSPIGYTEGNNIPVDSLSGFNVHSMVLEVPIERLKRGGEPVLGVWAATRRNPTPFINPNLPISDYVQVSRLGMPLVNEVVLPLALKDAFNTLKPEQDLSVYGLLQKSVEDPEIGRLLCGLYNVPLPGDANDDCSTEFTNGTPRTGRGDIFDIFLTGMVLENDFAIDTKTGSVTLTAPFTVNRPSGVVPAEMIRINTDIKGDLCSPTPSRLGVLGHDACGFPNGRRLFDDVIDIELLAVAGAAYQVLDAREAGFVFNAGLIGVLDDGLNGNDVAFRNSFPYMAMAQAGQTHLHQNPVLAVLLPFVGKVAVGIGTLGGMQPVAGGTSLIMAALIAPALIYLRRRR